MTIRDVMPDQVSAKNFLTKVANHFAKSNKVEASRILASW